MASGGNGRKGEDVPPSSSTTSNNEEEEYKHDEDDDDISSLSSSRSSSHSLLSSAVPASFAVDVLTSRGNFTICVVKAWAPLGASRFYDLVTARFYDQTRFYRVVRHWVVQFGLPGHPSAQRAWPPIANDPFPPNHVSHVSHVSPSNRQGYLSFSMDYDSSMHGVNRTTELFFNLHDNGNVLDDKGFTPIGAVTSANGYAVIRRLYGGYGEFPSVCNDPSSTSNPGSASVPCHGPDEARISAEGNAYLESEFPKMDYVETMRLVDERCDPLHDHKKSNGVWFLSSTGLFAVVMFGWVVLAFFGVRFMRRLRSDNDDITEGVITDELVAKEESSDVLLGSVCWSDDD